MRRAFTEDGPVKSMIGLIHCFICSLIHLKTNTNKPMNQSFQLLDLPARDKKRATFSYGP